jgi:drug/metabolite transporter (DMT)-like permease
VSVVFGLLSLAALPAALYATRLSKVNVPEAFGGEALAGTVLGAIAVVLARGGRWRAERSLVRVGERAARWGRWLGLLGLCLGLTAALSLAFYGLLLAFE